MNGGGTDLLYGGAGNVRYVVDSLGDLASEANRQTGTDDGGTDLVTTSINYMLASFVENLTLAGTATTGIDNELNNRLIASAGGSTLQGLGGLDRLDSGLERDLLQGWDGNDALHGGAEDDRLESGADADLLQGDAGAGVLLGETGNAGNNRLTGNAANNVLAVGESNDPLVGGAGDDQMFGEPDDDR